MELENIYRNLYYCCRKEAEWNRGTIVEDTRILLPQIQEFTEIISNPKNFDLKEEEYQDLLTYYMEVLNDIVIAMENHDIVLLYDALTYGLLEVMKLFLLEGEYEQV